MVAKAPRDGYTIGLGNIASHALNPLLMPQLPYDPVADFVPVSRVAEQAAVLAINPAVLPVKSIPELIAYAKANSGKLSYGSAGLKGSTHVGMELFAQKAGLKMTHVAYRGSASMVTDLLGGQVQLALDPYATL